MPTGAAANGEVRRRISGAVMRLRANAPFFAVLAMHADYVEDPRIPTAATDGRNIFYNPEYIGRLTQEEVVGLVLHEVLHCAFVHVGRRGLRDPAKWNIAADLVINPMILEQEGASLPEGALHQARFEGLRVEEAYLLVFNEEWKHLALPAGWADLRPEDEPAARRSDGATGPLATYWRNAVEGAVFAVNGVNGHGSLPRGAELLIGELAEPTVNWRELLREYTVEHPFDYGEYDLRLVGRGIYEESLEGEGLEVFVAIDTSGSCVEWTPKLLSELRGIMGTFPHVTAHVFYADAEIIGPYSVDRFADLPRPRGGGGTSFEPFFEYVTTKERPAGPHVLVYLTDGYGSFPQAEPLSETIWVVTPGGLPSKKFPFGRVIRLGHQA